MWTDSRGSAGKERRRAFRPPAINLTNGQELQGVSKYAGEWRGGKNSGRKNDNASATIPAYPLSGLPFPDQPGGKRALFASFALKFFNNSFFC
jgi:hypothetical protein